MFSAVSVRLSDSHRFGNGVSLVHEGTQLQIRVQKGGEPCQDWCDFILCWQTTSNFKNRRFTLLWMKWHILLHPFHKPCCCSFAHKHKYLCAHVPNPTVETPISFFMSRVLSFLEGRNRSQRVPDEKQKEWQSSFPCDYFISLFWGGLSINLIFLIYSKKLLHYQLMSDFIGFHLLKHSIKNQMLFPGGWEDSSLHPECVLWRPETTCKYWPKKLFYICFSGWDIKMKGVILPF